MLKFLNRLSWCVSIGVASTVIFLFGRSIFYIGGSFVVLVLVALLTIIIKKILFSKDYIILALNERGYESKKISRKEEKEIINEIGEKSDIKTSLENIAKPFESGLAKLAGGTKSELVTKEITENISFDKENIDLDERIMSRQEDDVQAEKAQEEYAGLDLIMNDNKEDIVREEIIKKDKGPNIIQAFFI